MTTVEEFVAGLQRDMTAADASLVLGIYDLDSERWLVRPDRDEDPDGFTGPGLVARIKGSDHAIEETGLTALLELANFAQDLVIDETGKSWPDVHHRGRLVHLDPVAHDEDVYWATKGEIVCVVGDLESRT